MANIKFIGREKELSKLDEISKDDFFLIVKGRRRIGKTSFEARSTKEGGVVNNVIADERTNTLIVHANAKGVEYDQGKVILSSKPGLGVFF